LRWLSLLPLRLNPMFADGDHEVENIWAYLRANGLAHQVWGTYAAIEDACCNAWNRLTRLPDVIRSIGTRG
jgi:hypothetical protein